MHVPQAAPGERLRGTVELDVETRQLRHHQRVAEALEEGLVARDGAAIGIDQPRLEFEPAVPADRVETPVVQQPAEQPGFGLEPP